MTELSAGRNVATAARIYDFLLGGVHNFPADRQTAQQAMAQLPDIAIGAQANRAFLRRAVRHLVAAGVHQFLDLGSGIPTQGNVHEIAQQVVPDARVLYVDIDPVAVAESQEIGADGRIDQRAIAGDPHDDIRIHQARRVEIASEDIGFIASKHHDTQLSRGLRDGVVACFHGGCADDFIDACDKPAARQHMFQDGLAGQRLQYLAR